MFLFLKEENKELIKKYPKLDFIMLCNIEISDKNSFKQQFEQLKDKIKLITNTKKAILITIKNIDNFLVSAINLLKKEFDILIGNGGLNTHNRFFIENNHIDLILDPHSSKLEKKFDLIHNFTSGLNTIFADLAKENKKGILVDLSPYLLDKNLLFKEIGRINQNILLCRKSKIPIIFTIIVSNENQIRTNLELKNILSIFNISNPQKKESEIYFSRIFDKNNENDIYPGIRKIPRPL